MTPRTCLILSLGLAVLSTAPLVVSSPARAATGAPECSSTAGTCGCQGCACDQCCLVQEVHTEKKWVYTVKLVPYCKTKCPNPFRCRHAACETCPACEPCVRYKRVLVKRAVESQKTVCKCVPACEACRARAAAGSAPLAGPTDTRFPGEPIPVPPHAR